MSREFFWSIVIGILLCGFVIYLTELGKKSEVNCAMLMGGWHPDLPKKYQEMCIAAKQERSDR